MERARKLTVLLMGLALLCAPVSSAAKIHSVQVTLGAAATQVTATIVPCVYVIFQNNAAHNIRVGDATVTATKGILLVAGPGGGTGLFTYAASKTGLQNWYIFGTAADVVDVLCEDGK
jgi:hypothetical protein